MSDQRPILPLRNSVLFPQATLSLAVGRERSVSLLQSAVENGQDIVVMAQKSSTVDRPGEADLYRTGCLARITKVTKVADGNYTILVQGVERVILQEFDDSGDFLMGTFTTVVENRAPDVESEALSKNLLNTASQVLSYFPKMPKETRDLISDTGGDPGYLCDFIASNLEEMKTEERQEVLEAIHLNDRLRLVLNFLARQLEVFRVSDKIQSQIKEEIDKNQREYYLRQQAKAIQDQLGDTGFDDDDLDEMADRIEETEMPDDIREACRKQLRRLRVMQSSSSEYGVVHTYLETLLEIPWCVVTEDNLSVTHARQILDEDHFGLDKVKKRIVEYLAVRKLKDDMKGPILCLQGPPGTGKTSIGRSLARALGRKFQRISLGGVHDESEIRGHRRTYVGAMPGRIVSALKKAGSINPVIMLDEIDKVGRNTHRGDPSAALLEVLDPEQNHEFSDHYVEQNVDLSQVLFIATANQLEPISAPLRDRMEIIELSGYTQHEKEQIARGFLIPKQLRNHGIGEDNFSLTDEALSTIIEEHTREAGVRALEKRIAAVCRGVAVKVAESLETSDEILKVDVDKEEITEYLGPQRYDYDVAQRTAQPGVSTGLAWTPVGGDILFIEATKMVGSGKLQITGQLGDVMKESIRAAYSYLKSNPEKFGLTDREVQVFDKDDVLGTKSEMRTFSQDDKGKEYDLHIHVPAGAVPKDGPSAGVAIFSALLSLFTGKCVRPDVAMTGEITLRGHVLPVGGIKEKVLAAHRAGIKRVLLPEKNKRDIIEIRKEVRDDLEFYFLTSAEEAVDLAFE